MWLGRQPFEPVAALQEELRAGVLAGRVPETLLLVEHDPVITLGRSADPAHVLASSGELARRGVAVAQASRGGDVTYHGPGQLVGYPVVRLRSGVVGHLRAMADGLAVLLAELGITARWRREAPGLWVERDGRRAKICAFGVNVQHRITVHGFALNVSSDLDAFRLIVPCGLRGVETTSIQQLTGTTPSLEALADRVAACFAASFGLPFARAI
jgi:lipoyl(octanoyl) transferase